MKNPEPASCLAGKHILLVEDNEINQMLVKYTLSPTGADVDVCDTGTQALQQLQQKTYDIILMDIHMPELDGLQTTNIIRNELKLKTPILAMTALEVDSEIQKCMLAGMNGSVPKPFTLEALGAAISVFVLPNVA